MTNEIIHLILEMRQEILDSYASKIQQWYRKMKANGYCEDCNTINELCYYPACEDFLITGIICCGKYICYDGCKYKCKNGHINKIYSDDGYFYTERCKVCSEKIEPRCTWYGYLNPREFMTHSHF